MNLVCGHEVSPKFSLLFAGPVLWTFRDGTTAKCVALRRDTDCVRVSMRFLHTQDYPPPVSLNNGPFQAFSAVEQFKDSGINETSVNFCVVPEAFENGSVEMRIKTQDSGTISNSVTLHANPGVYIMLDAVCQGVQY